MKSQGKARTPVQAGVHTPEKSVDLVWLFGLTLFASAFLMFSLEPIVGRLFLPKLGGAPVVWNTCLVFFQGTLLAGYAFAHGVHRLLGSARHALTFGLLVIGAAFWIPFAVPVPPEWADGHPIAWLLLALVTSVGMPFLVLASATSALQKWFSETSHPSARDPYVLYAASNGGSLLALLVYPIVVEPRLTLGAQQSAWAWAYWGFVGLALLCVAATAMRHRKSGPERQDFSGAASRTAINLAQRGVWLLLSFVPSSLLIGVTTFFSTDLTPVPLLWIVPLAIYLVTFVIAFGTNVRLEAADSATVIAVLGFTLLTASGYPVPFSATLLVHLVMFSAIALACHVRLARERPQPAHLTEFYLWVSAGGVLGGLFNALVAPVVFETVLEYPLGVVMGCAAPALVEVLHGRRAFAKTDALVAAAASVVVFALIAAVHWAGFVNALLVPILVFPLVGIYSQHRNALRFALSVGGVLLASSVLQSARQPTLHVERTYFGRYQVMALKGEGFRRLVHGTTLHGAQPLDPAVRGEPLTYFSRQSPIGQAFTGLTQLSGPIDVAVVGLGVGSLASYATAGQRWTFYEIDPAVERIARNPLWFTYLEACASLCRVVIGDARLSLQRTTDRYSLIVLDAFSSDAIPIHLLTREALALYLARLGPGGVVAFHVSNRHLNLVPIVGRLGAEARLHVLYQHHSTRRADFVIGITSSTWVFLARTRDDLRGLYADPRWSPPAVRPDTPLWTDDFSNILSALRIRN
jgi:hypothetical protein